MIKYMEKEDHNKHFSTIRLSGPSVVKAIKERSEITIYDRKGVYRPPITQHSFEGGITRILSWYERIIPSAMFGTLERKFDVCYNIYGDISGNCVYGENTRGLRHTVEWENSTVRVRTYGCVVNNVSYSSGLRSLVNTDLKDLGAFGKAVGMSTDSLKRMSSEDRNKLIKTFKVCMSGQNKITRLIKGCLHYLYMVENNVKLCFGHNPEHIDYTPENVSKQIGSNASYVWCSDMTNDYHVGALALMCSEYPHISGGYSHVIIPSDADINYVVGYGKRSESVRTRLITADHMWSTMVTYCVSLGLGNIFEKAMVIACLLKENRYLECIGLPSVISKCDLIQPAIGKVTNSDREKPMISTGTSTTVGRYLQLQIFCGMKDFISSCVNSSSKKRQMHDAIVHELRQKTVTLREIMCRNDVTGVLSTLKDIDIMTYASESWIKSIRKVSILEGLWVQSSVKCTHRMGSIHTFVMGERDLMGSSRDTVHYNNQQLKLIRELKKSDIIYDESKLPTGMFMVKGTHVKPSRRTPIRRSKGTLVDCAYDFDKDGSDYSGSLWGDSVDESDYVESSEYSSDTEDIVDDNESWIEEEIEQTADTEDIVDDNESLVEEAIEETGNEVIEESFLEVQQVDDVKAMFDPDMFEQHYDASVEMGAFRKQKMFKFVKSSPKWFSSEHTQNITKEWVEVGKLKSRELASKDEISPKDYYNTRKLLTDEVVNDSELRYVNFDIEGNYAAVTSDDDLDNRKSSAKTYFKAGGTVKGWNTVKKVLGKNWPKMDLNLQLVVGKEEDFSRETTKMKKKKPIVLEQGTSMTNNNYTKKDTNVLVYSYWAKKILGDPRTMMDVASACISNDIVQWCIASCEDILSRDSNRERRDYMAGKIGYLYDVKAQRYWPTKECRLAMAHWKNKVFNSGKFKWFISAKAASEVLRNFDNVCGSIGIRKEQGVYKMKEGVEDFIEENYTIDDESIKKYQLTGQY